MLAAMMPLSDLILMIVYAIGVVLSPFILGLFWKEKLNVEDCFPIACLSGMWPLVLAVLLIGAVGTGVVLFIGFLFRFPFELGQCVRHAVQKRKHMEREHDYVCD